VKETWDAVDEDIRRTPLSVPAHEWKWMMFKSLNLTKSILCQGGQELPFSLLTATAPLQLPHLGCAKNTKPCHSCGVKSCVARKLKNYLYPPLNEFSYERRISNLRLIRICAYSH